MLPIFFRRALVLFTFEVQLFSLHNRIGLEARRKITINFFAILMAEFDIENKLLKLFGKSRTHARN